MTALKAMPDKVENGTVRKIDGDERIYYDGYWIRYYALPNSLAFKKRLIDQLTRRVFHHAEAGINTPGERLEEVRAAYDSEQDQSRKRVLAAMLAGAMMNRGSDILTRIVELEVIGVKVASDNPLIRECGRCFMGALEYGKYIRPVTSKEGLDELWGEPFKAFTMPINQFLESRYIKIAQTMSEIDAIADKIAEVFGKAGMFAHLAPVINELAESAKLATETMRSDTQIIEIWPRFVGAADKIAEARPAMPPSHNRRDAALGRRGIRIIQESCDIIVALATIRIPMPHTTRSFLQQCDQFRDRYRNHLNGGKPEGVSKESGKQPTPA
jgi:hypothetical protein